MDTWKDCAEDSKMVQRKNILNIVTNTIILSGILNNNDYLNLVQCETLEDLKLHLQSTDYGNFLANESSLQVSVIDEKLREKLVTEFQHMRNQVNTSF